MKTYTVEFNITEIAKLITVCNMAVSTEEKYLEGNPSTACKDIIETSIDNIETIKNKICNAFKTQI